MRKSAQHLDLPVFSRRSLSSRGSLSPPRASRLSRLSPLLRSGDRRDMVDQRSGCVCGLSQVLIIGLDFLITPDSCVPKTVTHTLLFHSHTDWRHGHVVANSRVWGSARSLHVDDCATHVSRQRVHRARTRICRMLQNPNVGTCHAVVLKVN
jgi:hypothetical protein